MPIIGPVVSTFVSTDAEGNPVNVNEIGFHDPFTKVYQVVEDGTIIVTNADISETIAEPINDYPPAEMWTDPETGENRRIIQGRVVAFFDTSVTADWLFSFFAQNDLTVAMSFFEPDASGQTANEIAYFELYYGASWNSVDEVLSFLDGITEVQFASPVFLDSWQKHYAPPNDEWYNPPKNANKHLDILYSVNNPYIEDSGGYSFYRGGVAVLDSGVYRSHEDFTYTMPPPRFFSSPITKAGIDCYGGNPPRIYFGRDKRPDGTRRGEPAESEPAGYRQHGTQVAGAITAATNNSVGAAACAPRARVIPVYMQADQLYPNRYNGSAILAAYKAVNDWLQWDPYVDPIAVVNCSFGSYDYYWPEHQAIGLDVFYDNGYLWVAGAGNDNNFIFTYPAAYGANWPGDLVLGVTGLWVREDGQEFQAVMFGEGSNYAPPGYYPVSGIYGLYKLDGSRLFVYLPARLSPPDFKY